MELRTENPSCTERIQLQQAHYSSSHRARGNNGAHVDTSTTTTTTITVTTVNGTGTHDASAILIVETTH